MKTVDDIERCEKCHSVMWKETKCMHCNRIKTVKERMEEERERIGTLEVQFKKLHKDEEEEKVVRLVLEGFSPYYVKAVMGKGYYKKARIILNEWVRFIDTK